MSGKVTGFYYFILVNNKNTMILFILLFKRMSRRVLAKNKYQKQLKQKNLLNHFMKIHLNGIFSSFYFKG